MVGVRDVSGINTMFTWSSICPAQVNCSAKHVEVIKVNLKVTLFYKIGSDGGTSSVKDSTSSEQGMLYSLCHCN